MSDDHRTPRATTRWRTLWIEFLLMVGGVGAMAVSWRIDHGRGVSQWFPRSGAVAALAGALIAYRSLSRHYRKFVNANVRGYALLTSPQQTVVDLAALAVSAIGTAVWAYGDLLVFPPSGTHASAVPLGDLRAVVDVGMLVFTGVAALAAVVSAREARRAAAETRNATQAQLVHALLDEHSEPESLAAFLRLRDWRKTHGDEFARDFQRLRNADYNQVHVLDEARRRVALYAYKVHRLVVTGLIDDSVRSAVLPDNTAALCCEIVEPLEAGIRKEYDPTVYEWLAKVYGVTRRMDLFPGRSNPSELPPGETDAP